MSREGQYLVLINYVVERGEVEDMIRDLFHIPV